MKFKYLLIISLLALSLGLFVIHSSKYFKLITPNPHKASLSSVEKKGTASIVGAMHDCFFSEKYSLKHLLFIFMKEDKKTCPFCGMAILHREKIHSANLLSYDFLVIEPNLRKILGLETTLIKKMKSHKVLTPPAKIAYDPELYEAESDFIRASQSLEALKNDNQSRQIGSAQKILSKARKRLEELGLSERFIDRLASKNVPDRNLLYTDPMGEAWVYLNIYENEISLIKEGDSIEIEIPGRTGETVRSMIFSIDHAVDPITRSIKVRALVDNRGGVFEPGTPVKVAIEAKISDMAAVTKEAIIQSKGKNIVFVNRNSDEVFEKKSVSVNAMVNNNFYEAINGLNIDANVLIPNTRFTSFLERISKKTGEDN